MCFDLRLSTAPNVPLLDLFTQCQSFLAWREAIFHNAGRLKVAVVAHCEFMRLCQGYCKDPAETDRKAAIFNLAPNEGAESFIFLHAGKWEGHAGSPGTKNSHTVKIWKAKAPKIMFSRLKLWLNGNLFSKFVSASPGSSWFIRCHAFTAPTM